jgi:hypothetical protein
LLKNIDFLLLEKTLILCTIIATKIYNFIGIKIDRLSLILMKKFQTNNFVKQLGRIINHSILPLRLAAYEFCIMIFESTRIYTVSEQQLTIAEIFISIIGEGTMELLSFALMSRCIYTRKLVLSYFYSIFSITDQFTSERTKRHQNIIIKKSIKGIKKLNLFKIHTSLSNWLFNYSMIGYF